MSEVRVDNITGENKTDAVKFTKGINVTGIATVGNVSVGSSVTAATFFGNGAGLTGVSAGTLLKKTAYTIARQSIGSAASHGCVRMYNEDVINLFQKVQVGTQVVVEP